MVQRKIEENVKKFKHRIKSKFFVDKLIIFGSAAKGKMNKDSDIDIMVVSSKYGHKNVFKITPELYKEWHEKQKINYPVDFVLYSTKEFNKLKNEVSIVNEAVKDGVEM